MRRRAASMMRLRVAGTGGDLIRWAAFHPSMATRTRPWQTKQPHDRLGSVGGYAGGKTREPRRFRDRRGLDRFDGRHHQCSVDVVEMSGESGWFVERPGGFDLGWLGRRGSFASSRSSRLQLLAKVGILGSEPRHLIGRPMRADRSTLLEPTSTSPGSGVGPRPSRPVVPRSRPPPPALSARLRPTFVRGVRPWRAPSATRFRAV